MRRREFILAVGGAAARPLIARAQQHANLPTIGFIGSDSPAPYVDRLRAFRLGLKSTGFTEGQNVNVEYRWAEGRNDRLAELTADLVQRRVAVIVAPTNFDVAPFGTKGKKVRCRLPPTVALPRRRWQRDRCAPA